MTPHRPAPPRPRRMSPPVPPPLPRRERQAHSVRPTPPPLPVRVPRAAPSLPAPATMPPELPPRQPQPPQQAYHLDPHSLENTATKLSPPPPVRTRRERAADARERGEAAARRMSSMAQLSEIHPGDVIAERYRVTSVLGRARGLLLDAAHSGFEQRVVVRVISPALADSKAVDLFQRATRILSKLETQHVARIIDVGTLPNGSFYLV